MTSHMNTKSIAVAVLTMSFLAACQNQKVPGGSAASDDDPEVAAVPAEMPAVAAVSGFAPFGGATLQGAQRANCSIDRIGSVAAISGPVTLNLGQTVVFSGWIAGPGNQVPATFKVVLKGADFHGADATAGASRPDVARVLKSESLANSGFNARVDLGGLPEGEYGVSLVIPGEPVASCDTPAKVVIAPASSVATAAR